MTYFSKVKMWNANISGTVRAEAKMHGTIIVDFDIYHLVILTYFLKVKIWNFNISETVRTGKKI